MNILQVPEFEEAAFSAPLTKVIRCKSKSGWHLLQVLSERYVLETYVQLSIRLDKRILVLTLSIVLDLQLYYQGRTSRDSG